MPKLERKKLHVHLDKFAGSGPVTEEEIKEVIEENIPGATLGKKFKLHLHKKKKDGEIVKICIHFNENISNADIEQIRVDILVLAGVLEGGIGDQFPILVPKASDDFEKYTPKNTNIMESTQNEEGPDYSLLVDENALSHVNDPENLSTFKSTDQGVRAGELAGKLLLPGASLNTDAQVKAFFVTSEESSKIKYTATLSQSADPKFGKSEIKIPKVCDVIIYGSEYFLTSEADAWLNGMIVILSKDGTITGLGYASFDEVTGLGAKYEINVVAEVNGLYFDIFMKSVDNASLDHNTPDPRNICAYQENLLQTEGIVSSDLQSGLLSFAVKAAKSHNPATDYGSTKSIISPLDDDFDFGIEGGPIVDKTALYLKRAHRNSSNGAAISKMNISSLLSESPAAGFTIEGYFKYDFVNRGTIFRVGGGYSNPTHMGMVLQSNGRPALRAGLEFNEVSNLLPVDAWFYLAWVGDGTDMRLYINGTLSETFSGKDWTPYLSGNSNRDKFQLAYDIAKGSGVYMQEFRYSKVCRYTEDFTPPTTQFETDDDTLILLHLDEDYEGEGVVAYSLEDKGAPTKHVVDYSDQDAIIDELSVIAEG